MQTQFTTDQISVVYVSELREKIGSADFSDFDVVFFFLWYDAMRYGVKINGFEFRKTCVGIHSLSSPGQVGDWMKVKRV